LSALSPLATARAGENHIQGALDKSWRLVILSGLIPAFVALWFKLRIPESPRYTLDILSQARNPNEVKSIPSGNSQTSPSIRLLDFLRAFFEFIRQPRVWRVLLGTSATWFFLDLAFYGLSMNASAFAYRVLSSISTTPDRTIYQELIAWRRQLIFELPLGAILGGIITVFVLKKTGGRRIQMIGFAALTTIFLLTGTFYSTWNTAFLSGRGVLYAMYFTAQFAFNLGKNIPFSTHVNSS
jgi:PHS family inorganic phosphate transporter-like MFS transporter